MTAAITVQAQPGPEMWKGAGVIGTPPESALMNEAGIVITDESDNPITITD